MKTLLKTAAMTMILGTTLFNAGNTFAGGDTVKFKVRNCDAGESKITVCVYDGDDSARSVTSSKKRIKYSKRKTLKCTSSNDKCYVTVTRDSSCTNKKGGKMDVSDGITVTDASGTGSDGDGSYLSTRDGDLGSDCQ